MRLAGLEVTTNPPSFKVCRSRLTNGKYAYQTLLRPGKRFSFVHLLASILKSTFYISSSVTHWKEREKEIFIYISSRGDITFHLTTNK